MRILYEPVCHRLEHAPFNAALVAAMLEAFPGEELAFFAEPSHGAAVRAMLGGRAGTLVRWNDAPICPRTCRHPRQRLPYEWRIVSEVLRAADRSRARTLVACAITPTGLAALKCQLRLRSRRLQVAVMHHSGLASMMGSRTTQALLTWGNGTQVRHVVLGRSIRRSVIRELPGFAYSVASMRHPYLFPEPGPSGWPDQGSVRFGFLGLASRSKGFDAFCRLANRVAERCGSSPASPRFELVGRVGADCTALQMVPGWDRVEIDFRQQQMPRERYEQRVSELTYAVLPYAPEHYALVSSGAILDAFSYAKPCIALRNPLFEEYFSTMGDIGYLCDTEDEMFDVMSALVACGPQERYACQRRNILKGRAIFSPASVAEEFRAITGEERAVPLLPLKIAGTIAAATR